MEMQQPVFLALLVTALPLGAFVLQVFFGRFLPRQGDWLPTGAVGACLAISLYLFFTRVFGSEVGAEAVSWRINWISIGTESPFEVWFGVLVDNMTCIMLVVVTLVSFLVHVFSMGYMKTEERYNVYYAYLALFTFSMLGLVISSSILMLFIFWELVGVCSYFLIGFFWRKDSAAAACKKAFLVNRVGDTLFFLGIMVIWGVVGSFEFSDIYQSVATGAWNGATVPLWVAGLLIFAGAMTKSAQFPLHIWLPDAMEGPTPVSALIHAATMVAAGVYMIARMFPMLAGWDADAGQAAITTGGFFHSPALFWVALIGGVTAIFSATIAVAQYDIKKVLAYSTCSQLGYMVMGIGVGTVSGAMFHLFTHAMFKACLFLGSGSVIHAMHHEQDMRKMGGLRQKMPLTYLTFLVSTLALAGLPFFSGMISKEAILTQAMAYWSYNDWSLSAGLPFIMCAIAAGLTAFYMFRLVFMTFLGKPRDIHAYENAHESPPSMVMPLVVLAAISVIAAGVAVPGGIGTHWFDDRTNDEVLVAGMMLSPDVVKAPGNTPAAIADIWTPNGQYHHPQADAAPAGATVAVENFHHDYHSAHWLVFGIASGLGVLGILLAWWIFLKNAGKQFIGKGTFANWYRKVLYNKYFVDEFYGAVPIAFCHWLARCCRQIDKVVVDGLVNLAGVLGRLVAWISGRIDYHCVDGAVRGTGELTLRAGRRVRMLQTGRIQDYVGLTVFGMTVVFAVVMMWSRLF